jgi:hypothetical protein
LYAFRGMCGMSVLVGDACHPGVKIICAAVTGTPPGLRPRPARTVRLLLRAS